MSNGRQENWWIFCKIHLTTLNGTLQITPIAFELNTGLLLDTTKHIWYNRLWHKAITVSAPAGANLYNKHVPQRGHN